METSEEIALLKEIIDKQIEGEAIQGEIRDRLMAIIKHLAGYDHKFDFRFFEFLDDFLGYLIHSADNIVLLKLGYSFFHFYPPGNKAELSFYYKISDYGYRVGEDAQ